MGRKLGHGQDELDSELRKVRACLESVIAYLISLTAARIPLLRRVF